MAGFNKSPFAFDDMREIFERALRSPNGIKVVCRTWGHAFITRSRLYYLRKCDRTANGTIYPPDHPLHMRSIWDKLALRLKKKGAPDDHILLVGARTLEAEGITIESLNPEEALEEDLTVTSPEIIDVNRNI